MKKIVFFVVMLAVVLFILPLSGQAQDNREISWEDCQEYCATLGIQVYHLQPHVRVYDYVTVFIVAWTDFPAAAYDFTIQFPRELRPILIRYLDPLTEWDGVYVDSTFISDRRLRFVGWNDLGEEDNSCFHPRIPQRIIEMEFRFYPVMIIPRDYRIRFCDDPRFGSPAFGDSTGMHWIEARTWDYRLDSLWSPKIVGEEELPKEFALGQNYPNPFNAVTMIQFALPKASDVVIEIYDVLGRRVEELYSGFKAAGYHTVSWKASLASSGIYFYRIQAGDFTEVKRMTLVK